MAETLQRRRIIGNPGTRSSKRNPGDILGFTLGNPGRKAAKVAAKKAKKYNRSHSKARGSKRTRPNPSGGHRHRAPKHVARRYKRNTGGSASGVAPLVTNAVFVILGALGSKLGAQALLGTKNTGLLGYGANAGVGAGLWFLTEKVMKNRAASSGVIAGTIVQILLRAINDYTPFGQYVASLGMGDYQMQSFVTPQVLVDPTNSAEVRIPDGWAPRMLPPAPMPVTAGMSGTSIYGASGIYGR